MKPLRACEKTTYNASNREKFFSMFVAPTLWKGLIMLTLRIFLIVLTFSFFPLSGTASIVPCGGTFEEFVTSAKQEALNRGTSQVTIDAFFATVEHDPDVIKRDRSQGIFKKSFMEFSKLVMTNHRIVKGMEFEEQHGAVLDAVLEKYGVPRGVLLSFLALETDYGVVQGDHNTLNSIVTLSHDCRRPELFQPHLFAALELFKRDNFDPVNTVGAWAGEIGMIQMLPEDILLYGIDADGDGKVNLKESVADAMMTAGNVLNQTGWQPNQPWLVEVIVPENLDWSLAQPTYLQTLGDWKGMGIVPRDGIWPDPTYEAALLLPHGRLGPAFFAFPNYAVYLEWNKSFVYSTTSAFFATLLSGKPIYLDGNPPPPLADENVIRLQTILAERGHDVGKVDGIVGARTRAAVRQEQLNFDLPADSWPTLELLDLLEKN